MSDNRSVQYLPLAKLFFDRANPRLPDSLRDAEDSEILAWLIRKEDVEALMDSIGTTGYSNAEPLITVKLNDDRYEVVEGNRRLAAVKLLSNPTSAPIKPGVIGLSSERAKHKPDSLPVLVYGKREEVLDYLGYRHITGVKQWGSLEKAKYLKQLYERFLQDSSDQAEPFNRIAMVVATKPFHARKTLATLELYEKAKEKGFWKIQVDEIDFSVLGTAVSYKGIASFLDLESSQDMEQEELNEDHLRELFEWLFVKSSEGKARVSESRRLGSLAYVVSNEQALQAFRDGRTLEDAAQYTPEADENFRQFIEKSFNWLKAADNQINRVTRPNSTDRDLLSDISKIAQRLYLYLDKELSESAAN